MAKINGGHMAGNRCAQNPAYRRTSHFLPRPGTAPANPRHSLHHQREQLMAVVDIEPRKGAVATGLDRGSAQSEIGRNAVLGHAAMSRIFAALLHP